MNIANMNTHVCVSVCGQVRPLGLFEVLTAKPPKRRGDEEVLRDAHKNNQTECVQYLLDNDCPLPPGWRYEDGELYDCKKTRKNNRRIFCFPFRVTVLDDVSPKRSFRLHFNARDTHTKYI